jgi:hypothetical protein
VSEHVFRIAGYLPIGPDGRAIGTPISFFSAPGAIPAKDSEASIRRDIETVADTLANFAASRGIVLPEVDAIAKRHGLTGIDRVADAINRQVRLRYPDLAQKTSTFSAPAPRPRHGHLWGCARVAAAINADFRSRNLTI